MFKNCVSLKTVSVKNARIIGSESFANCTSLHELDLTEVVAIRSNAFANCNSLKITAIPRVLNYVGDHVFENIDITGTFTIRRGEYSERNDESDFLIKNYAFSGIVIDQLWVDKNVTIAPYAFYDAKINFVSLSKNTSVSSFAFAYSQIIELMIDENSTVEQFAFSNISTLETVTLIDCSIKQDAFYMTKSIKILKIDGIKLDLQSGCFQNIFVCIYYHGNEDYYKDTTITVINGIQKAIFVKDQYELTTFCGIPVQKGLISQCPAERKKYPSNNQPIAVKKIEEVTCQDFIPGSKAGYYLSLLVTFNN